MGLDLVEFVMRLEEEFETSIPDEAAGTLETPGDVIEYLMARPEIRARGSTREEIAAQVWSILEDETGIDPSRFDERSRFIEDMHID